MRRITWLLLGLLIVSFNPGSALAGALVKNVIATIDAGSEPRAVAVDAATNRIYVANETPWDPSRVALAADGLPLI